MSKRRNHTPTRVMVGLKNQNSGQTTPYPFDVAQSILKTSSVSRTKGYELADEKYTFKNGVLSERKNTAKE